MMRTRARRINEMTVEELIAVEERKGRQHAINQYGSVAFWKRGKSAEAQDVDELISARVVALAIKRTSVEACDLSDVAELMKRAKEVRGKVLLTVSGYGLDRRGLPEIPEFVTWAKALHKTYPHWSLLARDYCFSSQVYRAICGQQIRPGGETYHITIERSRLLKVMSQIRLTAGACKQMGLPQSQAAQTLYHHRKMTEQAVYMYGSYRVVTERWVRGF